MNRTAIAIIAIAILLAASFWAGWEWRDRSADIRQLRADLKFATAANDALVETLETERTAAAKMAQVADTYEKERADALDREAGLRADLAAGTVKLRKEWGNCETSRLSDTATATRQLDAAAEVRERLAAEIIRLGADADAQVRGLQAVIQQDRASQ